MTAPTFRSVGALKNEPFDVHFAIAMPAGATSGDLLIMVAMNTVTAKEFTAPAGWVKYADYQRASTLGMNVFAKVCDGTEGSTVNVTWTGNSSARGQIICYTGLNGTTLADMIGAVSDQDAGQGTPVSTVVATGLTTTTNNARVLAAIVMNGTTGITGTPTGYTSRASAGSMAFVDEVVNTLGSASNNISQGMDASGWFMVAMFELCSEAPPPTVLLQTSMSDESSSTAALTTTPVANLAASMVDDASTTANLIVAETEIDIHASMSDDASTSADLTLNVPLFIGASMTDGATMFVQPDHSIETAPPVQCVVVVNT